ncbi:MAG: adenylate/guanylate cyclase domain-containing protein, partial [Steroidobacteraceae bacterium]
MVKDSRKLAAILAADVVEYSRLMSADEAGTLAALRIRRAVFDELVKAFDGLEFGSVGDSLMAEFPSAVNAVQCALAVQQRIENENSPLPAARRMQLRIGVNLGDVIKEHGSAFGDTVNIAARLQALAKPGGVLISGPVYDQVHLRLPARFIAAGARQVKNIAEPVRTFEVLAAESPGIAGRIAGIFTRIASRRVRRAAAGIAALVIAVALGLLGREIYVSNTGQQVGTLLGSLEQEPTPNSIAVLPFADMSEKQDQEYMSDGIAEELLNLLAQVPELKVIARTSSFAFKGEKIEIAEIAKKLNVANVLEGSIRKAGNTLRISAQLIRAADSTHLWSETYDRPVDDIFKVQNEIANAIVQALQIRLAGGEVSRRKGGTLNVEAYQLHLRAMSALNENTKESLDAAGTYLEQATRLDPDYGMAWYAQATVVSMKTDNVWLAPTEGWNRVRQLAQRALQLSPDLAEAHARLQWAYMSQDWDWPAAEAEGRQALAIDPT